MGVMNFEKKKRSAVLARSGVNGLLIAIKPSDTFAPHGTFLKTEGRHGLYTAIQEQLGLKIELTK
jgi:hypothetical protein